MQTFVLGHQIQKKVGNSLAAFCARNGQIPVSLSGRPFPFWPCTAHPLSEKVQLRVFRIDKSRTPTCCQEEEKEKNFSNPNMHPTMGMVRKFYRELESSHPFNYICLGTDG